MATHVCTLYGTIMLEADQNQVVIRLMSRSICWVSSWQIARVPPAF